MMVLSLPDLCSNRRAYGYVFRKYRNRQHQSLTGVAYTAEAFVKQGTNLAPPAHHYLYNTGVQKN